MAFDKHIIFWHFIFIFVSLVKNEMHFIISIILVGCVTRSERVEKGAVAGNIEFSFEKWHRGKSIRNLEGRHGNSLLSRGACSPPNTVIVVIIFILHGCWGVQFLCLSLCACFLVWFKALSLCIGSAEGRRQLRTFKELRGNTTFKCSPSGPCVACHYSEKVCSSAVIVSSSRPCFLASFF